MADKQNNQIFDLNVKGDINLKSIESGVPLYHRPKDSRTGDPLAIIKSLMKYGFSREYTGSNGGNMYGPGVYNVINLKSSNESATGYGSYIVRSYLLGGYKNFLIFNADIAKEVYGNNWWIGDQIMMLCPPKIATQILNRVKLYMNDNRGNVFVYKNYNGEDDENALGRHRMVRTSDAAVSITNLLGGNISNTKIRGIQYSGGHDGDCAFVRNFSEVIPHSYSKDNGKTWITAITDELIYRAAHELDVDASLRDAKDESGNRHFDDVADRSINGYVITYKNIGDKKKANYYEVAENKLISEVWFDMALNFDEDGFAKVMYAGQKFFITKYEDGEYVACDETTMPVCYLKDLPQFVMQNENKIYAQSIINECLQEILTESKSLVDNFDKVAKLLEFNSPDDFYFVQIIKRFKDNPYDDKTQGNYHAGGWYLKSWRVRSVDELINLKPEIVKWCEDNNARAYITINSRSEQETNDFIKIYRDRYSPSDARHMHADEIVPGQAKDGPSWKGQRKRLFLDIDCPKTQKGPDGRNIWDEVRYMIQMVGITPLDEYETPSGGLHIILPDKGDKNLFYLKRLFNKFDNWKYKGKLSTVHTNVDGKIILYSNVDTKGY
jgi:hypothetical protein